jgi:hypothetical protein
MRAYMLIAQVIEQERLAEAAEARLVAQVRRERVDEFAQDDAPTIRVPRIRGLAGLALVAVAAAVFGIGFI